MSCWSLANRLSLLSELTIVNSLGVLCSDSISRIGLLLSRENYDISSPTGLLNCPNPEPTGEILAMSLLSFISSSWLLTPRLSVPIFLNCLFWFCCRRFARPPRGSRMLALLCSSARLWSRLLLSVDEHLEPIEPERREGPCIFAPSPLMLRCVPKRVIVPRRLETESSSIIFTSIEKICYCVKYSWIRFSYEHALSGTYG